MTTDKARKRAVRTRMSKTGERYTAARRHVVASDRSSTPDPSAPLPPRVADPGSSDAAVIRGTGHDWDHWLRVLDDWGAMERSHRDIARYLQTDHGIPGWWAQNVTVGYERARGRRAMHETTRGFEVSVSKTIHAPADDIWSALEDPTRRAGWVASDALNVAKTSAPRWIRFDVVGESSSVTLHLDALEADRSRVTATASRLADADAVSEQRTFWRARLAELARGFGGVAPSARRSS